MALAVYNGFPGRVRERSARLQEEFWTEFPEQGRPEEHGCMACLQRNGLIQGHLEDYSQVEVNFPLCVTCHMMLHMRWQPDSCWEDYKTGVRYGFQGRPVTSLSVIFPYLRRHFPKDLHSDRFYVNEFRPATVLDALCPIRFTHPNAPKETP